MSDIVERVERINWTKVRDGDTMVATGHDLQWLIGQLVEWPDRIDPACTTNASFLMCSGARTLQSQAAEIARLRDEVERLEANLALRDSFIVAQGMWSEFVEQLPFRHSIAVTREGKTKIARAALDG